MNTTLNSLVAFINKKSMTIMHDQHACWDVCTHNIEMMHPKPTSEQACIDFKGDGGQDQETDTLTFTQNVIWEQMENLSLLTCK